MILLAVRRNRFMVLTDSTRKGQFQEYVDEVMLAFDDAARFDEKQLSVNGASGWTG
jgi:hypothetical protein